MKRSGLWNGLPVFFGLVWVIGWPAIAQKGKAEAAVLRYFESPCRDDDADGVDDFFGGEVLDAAVDILLVFDSGIYSPATAEAQVDSVLQNHPPSFKQYVSAFSPYAFIGNVVLSQVPSATPLVRDLLGLPGAVGIRAYERFMISTGSSSFSGEARPGLRFPEDGRMGGEGPGRRVAPSSVMTPDPDIQILQIHPSVLAYFVDSGIDEPGYWGIDVVTQNPLAPQQAQDPLDSTTMKHGSFLSALFMNTVAAAQTQGGGNTVSFADVKVAVGPKGETTTLELTRAFDAIVAHQLWERARGRSYEVVVNCSYDTDGGIANHDIIYESPEGWIEWSPEPARDTRTLSVAVPNSGNPCSISLFDAVYENLAGNYNAVISVGAGNDGETAQYVINEVGQSSHVTIVTTAIDPRTAMPASYSNYAEQPNGINGHPDLAALGVGGVPEFGYALQGTSVAAAYSSAMSAVVLSRDDSLLPQEVLQRLIAAGSPIPPTGNKLYGQAILTLPWSPPPHHVIIDPEPIRIPIFVSPNPARRAARISFDLKAPFERVQVRVFDLTGRLVRALDQGPKPAGRHEVVFDGRLENGAPAPAGIYFARVDIPGHSGVVRFVIQGR